MSWQREKRGRNQPKQGTKKRRENRAALLVQQNFLLENAGVSHRVHPSTQSTDFLCLLPPLFSNVSTWKSCFSPQTSVNFPSLQKKKKERKKESIPQIKKTFEYLKVGYFIDCIFGLFTQRERSMTQKKTKQL